MSKKRRRSSSELLDYIARIIIFLGILSYAPIVNWWKDIPPSGRIFLISMVTIVIMAGIGTVIMLRIYFKRERGNAWRRAMAGWQSQEQTSTVVKKQSAKYMSDVELERFAAQIYSKMGYKVQHVGTMGDHGIDVMLINPNNQKEIVQCKQWHKPVGEPTIRDLYGAMAHEKAVRAWLWAPHGFSQPALAWAKGKSIELIDDKRISQLIGLAYGSK